MTSDPDRESRGKAAFEEILGQPMHPPSTPFSTAARDFVFAEVWSRPGLDRRSRRWITLACVCAAGAPRPMRIYLEAALDSGEITADELREFVLQFGVFQGFPKAAEIEVLLTQILQERAAKG